MDMSGVFVVKVTKSAEYLSTFEGATGGRTEELNCER
jgi:hypothetical protein